MLAFAREQRYNEKKLGSIHYFTVDSNWQNLSQEILAQKQIIQSWGAFKGNMIMEVFPFFKKPLITVSRSGRIFTAYSNEFFITEYTPQGSYLKAFFYPYKKIKLSKEDILMATNEITKKIADQIEIPMN